MGVNRSNTDQYQLRLPPGLRDRIKAAADGNGRSMNSEIVSTLESAFPDPRELLQELSFIDEIDAIQARLERIRAARIAEASENLSDEFIEANAKKLKSKYTPDPDEEA